MKRWKSTALALALLLLASMAWPAFAQEGIAVTSNTYECHFPEGIIFCLEAQGENEIDDITLFYRVGSEEATSWAHPDFAHGREVEAEYKENTRLSYLPPGVEIEYWWEIKDEAGNELKTDPIVFTYGDARYPWQELRSGKLSIYWYEGDEEFGQAIFDKATASLDRLCRETGISVEGQVKVFIYGRHSDLLGALGEGAKEWTGGVAFTEYGVILIGVPPADLSWGKRAVAHELTHLVVHQATDNPFGDLPRWLDEGLAMRSEGELEPTFIRALEQATNRNELISIRSISSSFPADSALAHLCYAESYSVVDFIIEHYGEEKMAGLLDIFSEGAYYDDALKEALGVDTDGLEDAWREHIGAPPREKIATPAAILTPEATAVPKEPIPHAWPCCGLLPGTVLAIAAFLALKMIAR